MNKFTDKVAAGAVFLDINRPGWAEKIDLDTLNFGSGSHCVIGQSVGQYIDGIGTLGLSAEQALTLGYNVPHPSDYEELTHAWVPLIQERQQKAARTIVVTYGVVEYVIELNSLDLPVIRRVSVGGEQTDTFQLGNSDPRVCREIGEAFIALADNRS